MPTLDPKPDPIRPGQKQISAEALNKIIRATDRQLYGSGDTVVNFFGDRPVIASKDSKITPGIDNYVQQFMILGETDDYLICTQYTPPNNSGGPIPQTYDPTNGDPNSLSQQPGRVYIAKPYALQRAPWDGQLQPIESNIPEAPGTGLVYNYTGIPLSSDGTPQFGAVVSRAGTLINPLPQAPFPAETIQPLYLSGDLILATQAISGLYDPNQNLINWMDVNTAARVWSSESNVVVGGIGASIIRPMTFEPNTPQSIPWQFYQNGSGADEEFFPSDNIHLVMPVAGIYAVNFQSTWVEWDNGTQVVMSLVWDKTSPASYYFANGLMPNAQGFLMLPVPGNFLGSGCAFQHQAASVFAAEAGDAFHFEAYSISYPAQGVFNFSIMGPL